MSKRIYFLLLGTVFTISTITSCGEKREVIPFFDGLYFVYDLSGWSLCYKVEREPDGNFRIILIEQYKKLEHITEVEVNPYGKILKSTDKNFYPKGKKMELWLPKSRRQKGAKAFGHSHSYVVDKKQWERWETWVVKSKLNPRGAGYYEATTGFLVGIVISGGFVGGRQILVETNTEIPEIDSEKIE